VNAPAAPLLAFGEQACMHPLPLCEHGWPDVPVQPCSGSGRRRRWNSMRSERDDSEKLLGSRFRHHIRAPRARVTPFGLKFQRDGPPAAAAHELVPFSAISAPFGPKRRGKHALAHKQPRGDVCGGHGVLTYWAGPPRPLVCMVQPRLLLAQQRDGGAPACHGGE
jgi:hypothetical protein